MRVNVALLALALFACGGLAALVGGCGDSATHTNSVTVGANGVVYVGTNTITTRTRTVQGTTETLYVRHGVVSGDNTRHVVIAQLPHVGVVLVNGAGYPIYAFVSNKPGSATCSGSCAATWPPIRLTIETAIDSSPALAEELVSTEPDPERHEVGDRVVKFAGRVLHTYTGDKTPWVANGEGLESYGGRWYLISPSGVLIK